MYKLAMPINMGTINDETLPKYLEKAKKCDANRIFLCGMGLIYSKSSRIYTEYDKIKSALEYFRSHGFEVGIWCQTLGNGHSLTIVGRSDEKFDFTQITGIGGESRSSYSNCPLDENFIEACKTGMRHVASLDPVVELDGEYSEIRFINCNGRLDGDKVYISDMAAYGLCAFEVKNT